MRKVISSAFVSLDGVMQAPGGPAEDPAAGFEPGAAPGALKLKSSSTTGKGVTIATYAPAGAVATGSFAGDDPTQAERARRERWTRQG